MRRSGGRAITNLHTGKTPGRVRDVRFALAVAMLLGCNAALLVCIVLRGRVDEGEGWQFRKSLYLLVPDPAPHANRADWLESCSPWPSPPP